jgi:hypothetical protein
VGHVARMDGEQKYIVKEPENKRAFRRPRCRWEKSTSIGKDLRQIWWEVVG